MEDGSVTWLEDSEEFYIAELWLLSLDGGFSGAVCNYDVIRDSCNKSKLDVTDVYRVCKSMTNEMNVKD